MSLLNPQKASFEEFIIKMNPLSPHSFMSILISFYIITCTIDSLGSTVEAPDDAEKPEATRILKFMDKRVEPCEDFYDFACGEFLKKAKLPKGYGKLYALYTLQNEIDRQMVTAIEEPTELREPKPITLMKRLYQSCMNTTAIEEAGLNRIKEILKSLGGWPILAENPENWNEEDFDWFGSRYSKWLELGFPIADGFLELITTPDLKNSTRKMLQIQGIRPFKTYGRKYDGKRNYFDYMVDIAVIFGANRTRAREELLEPYKLEVEIQKIFNSTIFPLYMPKNPTALYNPMTLKDLEGNFTTIPWRKYFNANLKGHEEVGENEMINVITPAYFKELDALLQKSTKRTLANYLMWRTVEANIPYLNEEIRQDRGASRSMKCFGIIDSKLDLIIRALYARKYTNEKAKKTVVEMIPYIQRRFKKFLEEIDWMDNKTKTNARSKLETMIHRVAHPDELLDDGVLTKMYENLEITTGDFLQSIMNITIFERNYTFSEFRKPINKSDWKQFKKTNTVNAYYSRNDNSLNLPSAILRGAFFDENRPMYINFATIGSTIGHEISHAFDTAGNEFDAEGNLLNWWDPETKLKFQKKLECLIHQYGNYTVKELGWNMNGVSTQRENTADNAGFKIAYLAYHDWLEQHPPELPVPGLKYMASQLFWISAAQMFCEKKKPEDFEYQILSNEHSPGRFRVLGTFSNSPEFARDFNCTVGQKMNPEKKCSVW